MTATGGVGRKGLQNVMCSLTECVLLQVEKAEKEREKDRRARVRKDKADSLEAVRLAKINKSILLSLAPVVKRTV